MGSNLDFGLAEQKALPEWEHIGRKVNMAVDTRNSGSVPPPNNPYYSQFFPAQNVDYEEGNNSGTGNIAVITPTVMGVPENQTYGMPSPDYAEGLEQMNRFSDASIRRGFVRKVYLTLMIQLLVTTGIICVFLYWKALKNWTLDNHWFPMAMILATFFLLLMVAYCGEGCRKVPLNFIFFGLFTIVEGVMLGSVAVYYDAEAVLWAVGATALVSFSLTLFAMQSKWDFTYYNGILWVLCWSLFSFGLLCAILESQYVYIMCACLGTTFFSVYLVVDTQLMLGGKHRYSLDPEEYIFAALNLYLDIVTLFLLINQLVRLCR